MKVRYVYSKMSSTNLVIEKSLYYGMTFHLTKNAVTDNLYYYL